MTGSYCFGYEKVIRMMTQSLGVTLNSTIFILTFFRSKYDDWLH